MSKGLKASQGAVNLVKYGRVLKLGATDPWESVVKGYKLSKSTFNVFDGATEVAARGYGRVKSGLKGAGVVFRALVLSKQVYGVLFQGLGISHASLTVLSEELENKKKDNMDEEATLVALRKGKLHMRRRVYCSGLAGVGSKKGLPLPLMYVLSGRIWGVIWNVYFLFRFRIDGTPLMRLMKGVFSEPADYSPKSL